MNKIPKDVLAFIVSEDLAEIMTIFGQKDEKLIILNPEEVRDFFPEASPTLSAQSRFILEDDAPLPQIIDVDDLAACTEQLEEIFKLLEVDSRAAKEKLRQLEDKEKAKLLRTMLIQMMLYDNSFR